MHVRISVGRGRDSTVYPTPLNVILEISATRLRYQVRSRMALLFPGAGDLGDGDLGAGECIGPAMEVHSCVMRIIVQPRHSTA